MHLDFWPLQDDCLLCHLDFQLHSIAGALLPFQNHFVCKCKLLFKCCSKTPARENYPDHSFANFEELHAVISFFPGDSPDTWCCRFSFLSWKAAGALCTSPASTWASAGGCDIGVSSTFRGVSESFLARISDVSYAVSDAVACAQCNQGL